MDRTRNGRAKAASRTSSEPDRNGAVPRKNSSTGPSRSSPEPGPSAAQRRDAQPARRKLDAADLLAIVWESAPGSIDPYDWVLVTIGCIQHGSRISSVDEIESYVADPVLNKLPSTTKIPSVEKIVSIEQHLERRVPQSIRDTSFYSKGTEVVLGPVAEWLRERGADKHDPRVVADATEYLVETGDVSQVEALFSRVGSSKTGPATPPADDHDPTHHTPETGAPTTTDSHGAANEVNYLGFGGLFGTPPVSRLSAYEGRFGPDIVAVNRRTACTPDGGSSRDGRPLERLDTEKERELLDRTPLGSVPRVSFPTEEVYERIVEWRPILKWAKPLAAILQLVLISGRRDDNFDPELPCTGMPLWHELVLAAFGFHSRQHAQKHGVNTRMLIELFCKHIDSDFHVSAWNSDKDLARVVLCHSIPSEIIEAVEEHMLGPEEPDDSTYLINGLSADRGNNCMDHKDRVQEVEERETEIPLPDFTKRMQSYLHGFGKGSFKNSRYGYVGKNIEQALAAAREEFQDAQRRRQVLRKLCMIRQYPKPLYPGCDYFPRLTAEGHNQLMNMPSKILRTLYTDRDRELDLSKAHLATTVPLARKNNIDAAVLEEHLDRNLTDEDYDLWMDIASYFDVEYMPAARTAAKKLYAGGYGGSKQEVLRQMCFAYADAGGTQLGYEPFKPVLEHPLVDELFHIREEIQEVIKDRGYLVDAAGRKIRPEMMTHKDEGDRWKPVMAYVNASFEQKLMSVPFDLAIEEQKRSRPRFTIWLYQSDGITVRVSSRASTSHQVQRLQDAVQERANELGVPTELEVDWPE